MKMKSLLLLALSVISTASYANFQRCSTITFDGATANKPNILNLSQGGFDGDGKFQPNWIFFRLNGRAESYFLQGTVAGEAQTTDLGKAQLGMLNSALVTGDKIEYIHCNDQGFVDGLRFIPKYG